MKEKNEDVHIKPFLTKNGIFIMKKNKCLKALSIIEILKIINPELTQIERDNIISMIFPNRY